MAFSARLAVSAEDQPLIEDAVAHLRSFYSDMEVLWDGDSLRLSSETRDPAALAGIWEAALTTERLFQGARRYRAAAREALSA